MALPTWKAKGLFTNGTGALAVPWPTTGSYAVGDYALLFVESSNETIAAPSGWSEVANSPQGTGTAATEGAVRLAAFQRFAASTSESTVTIADTGDHTTAQIHVFGGVDATTPINVSAGSVLATADVSWTFPSVTTTRPDCLIVNAAANDRDTNSAALISGWTNSSLSSLTERHDQTVANSTGGGLAIASGGLATAGGSGETTATNVTSTTAAYLTIALNPAVYTQTLSPSLLTNAQTFYSPTVSQGGGGQTVSPNLLANAQTFFEPTVTPGAVSVAPNLLTNEQTFFSPTLTVGAVTVSPSLLVNEHSFPAATVSPGTVTLSPSLLTNAQTFFEPTVSQSGDGQTVAPNLLVNEPTFFEPTVAPSAVVVAPAYFENPNEFFAPTITPSNTLLPSRLNNVQVFYPPTVTRIGIYWPDPSEVLAGVAYGPNGDDYVGTLDVKSLRYDINTGELVKPLFGRNVMSL